uniref:Putative secreted protein n=1 Tax=Ixodes ricinus TaxID=34613 RepID=A0A6B0UEL6_IXORI
MVYLSILIILFASFILIETPAQVTIYVVETVGATKFRNMETVLLQSRNNVVATVITLQKCPLLNHCGNCVGQPLIVSCSQQLPKHCFYPAKCVLS